MYQITDYTKTMAIENNVIVKPSTKKNKKIDIYTLDGKKIASIGDIRYFDYPTYLITKGKMYAEQRRRLYKIRHNKDINNFNSPGYWANILLW